MIHTFRPSSLLAILLAFSMLSACSLQKMIKKAKQQDLALSPNPLELHGDSVQYTLAANLPAGLLRKNKVYTIQLEYKYADKSTKPADYIFNAKDFPKAKSEQIKGSKKFSFAYEGEQMHRGELFAKGIAANINGKSKATQPIALGRGLILTSKSYELFNVPITLASGYNSMEEMVPTKIGFFFDQGSDKLRKDQIVGTSGRFLDNFIASKNVYKSVTITGTHSPEGREAKNVDLSAKRAKVIETFYRGKLKKFDYKKEAKQITFVSKSLLEDFRPLKDTLEKLSTFDATEKAAILQIVDAPTGTFTEKQTLLEALAFYPKIFTDLYPKLRIAETEIQVIKEKKSEATINLLAAEVAAGTKPFTVLTDQELAFAATLTPDLTEKEKILMASTKKNDFWQSHHNLASLYIEKAAKATGEEQTALLDKALVQVEIALNKKSNTSSMVNKAIIQQMKGDKTAALATAEAAQNMNPAEEDASFITAILAPLYINLGKYEKANAALKSANANATTLYNLGLASYLKKDYLAANSNLEKAIQKEPKFAKAHYLQAVVASRTKNMALLGTSLSNAIGLQSSLKLRALADMEFEQVKDKAEFKAALR